MMFRRELSHACGISSFQDRIASSKQLGQSCQELLVFILRARGHPFQGCTMGMRHAWQPRKTFTLAKRRCILHPLSEGHAALATTSQGSPGLQTDFCLLGRALPGSFKKVFILAARTEWSLRYKTLCASIHCFGVAPVLLNRAFQNVTHETGE